MKKVLKYYKGVSNNWIIGTEKECENFIKDKRNKNWNFKYE